MDFLKTLNLDDQAKPGQDRGLLGKLGGVLQSQIQSHPAPHSTAPQQGGLLGKLGDALHHATAPPTAPAPAPAAPVKEDGSLIGKIGKISSALGGEKPAHGPTKDEGLFGKINSVIGGGHQEPAKPQSLSGKLNHALGGGAAGEQKEGNVGLIFVPTRHPTN